MNDKGSFQDVWAATDKSLIDIMKQTSNPSSKTSKQTNFSESSSDSDSDSSSEGSFVAVPQEFRPNLEINKSPTKTSGEPKFTPNQCSNVPSTSQTPSRIMSTRNFVLNNLVCANPNSILEHKIVSQNNVLTSETKALSKEKNPLNKICATEHYNRTKDSNELHISENKRKPLKACRIPRSKCSPCYKMKLRKQTSPLKPKQTFKHETKFSEEFGSCIKYERIDHSDQDSRVKTIELDFANLSTVNNTRVIQKVEFEILQEKSEQKCFANQRDRKTECNNSERKHQSYFKDHSAIRSHGKEISPRKQNSNKSCKPQFSASLRKNTCVRWNSTLSLNNPNYLSQDFAFPKPEIKDKKFPILPNNNKVEWTFVREERTFVSATKLDDSDDHKSDTDHELIDENAVDLNYDQLFLKDISLKDNLYNAKFNSGLEVNRRKCFLSTKPKVITKNYKQHPIQFDNSTTQEPSNSETHFGKDSLKKQSSNAPNFQQMNRNVNKNTEVLAQTWHKKSDSYKQKYTTYKENDQTHCKQIDVKNALHTHSCVNQTPKFQYNMEKDSKINECDQYVNQPNEYSHQEKMGMQNSVKQNESFSQVESNNFATVQENHSLIEYGKEMSDLIIGCYDALSTFISFYNEWRYTRCELIEHFEQLENSLKDSTKNHNRLKDVIKVAQVGTAVAVNIPHPYVSITAKVISILTSLASTFISEKNTRKVDEKDPKIISLLSKDIDASSEFYMYSLMCNQQFEETTKLIENFHSSAVIQNSLYTDCEDTAIFLRGVLEYKPRHRIFYKKLHECFKKLLQKGSSEFSRRFCEPFLLYSTNAVDVIECLQWRFAEEYNNASVKHELEEIHKLIENSNSTSMDDLFKKIRNCIVILKDELKYAERSASKITLFDNSI